jgi:O-antigen/teichoic acid export membrane protein
VNPVAAIASTAFAGQMVTLALSVLLARRLDAAEFEAYVLAASAFLLMVAVAPLGIDKLAVRLLPSLIERGDLGGARGFLRFGMRRVLASAVAIAALAAAFSRLAPGEGTATAAMLATCLALPAGTLGHLGLEVLTALGGERRATAILRLHVPLLALVLTLAAMLFVPAPAGWMAIAAWLVAWLAALGVLYREIRWRLPPKLEVAAPVEEMGAWTREAVPFLVYRGVLALIAQSSLIVLGVMHQSPVAVGAYAAAAATIAPVLALFTATNRAYVRRLSVHLERGEFDAIHSARRERLAWLLPAVAVLVIAALIFPREIIGLFGRTYQDEGAGAVRILALSTAFTMTFSMAPTYIKFTRKQGFLLAASGLAVAAQLLLLSALVPRLGATGAALAYGISLSGLYSALALIAWRDLTRRRKSL